MTDHTSRLNVQLYSVRDLIGTPGLFAKNHEHVLRSLVMMGYTGVEAISYDDGRFSGLAPEEFRKTINDAGLELVSSHVIRMVSEQELASGDFSEALEWWDKCISAHKKAGIPRLVMCYSQELHTKAGLECMTAYLNAIGLRCNEAGIRFGYHNHSHEFKEIDGTTMLDHFIMNTDPEKVFFELDVYWAMVGGTDPAEYMTIHPGRFEILHIKDEHEVGRSGMMDFDSIFLNLDKAGTRILVVEMEEPSTSDSLEGLRESAEVVLSLIERFKNN